MLSVEQGIGLVVIDESLVQRIPVQRPRQAHGNMVDQTGRASAMANFYRGDGLFSGGNAIKPIAMVLLTAVEIDFIGANHRFDDFGVAGRKCFLVGNGRLVSACLVNATGNKDPAL